MKTKFISKEDGRILFSTRWIAVGLLAVILLVLGVKASEGARLGEADAGQTLPGGWAGDFTLLN